MFIKIKKYEFLLYIFFISLLVKWVFLFKYFFMNVSFVLEFEIVVDIKINDVNYKVKIY